LQQDLRHVSSEYSLVVNQINVTVLFEANFNFNRRQESEILLKISDNQFMRNILFLYYTGGTLFYEMTHFEMGFHNNVVPSGTSTRGRYENFGSDVSFDMFFAAMQIFDLGAFFFADPDLFGDPDEFLEEETDLGLDTFAGYVAQIIAIADTRNLNSFRVNEHHQNITITDVVLDPLKDPVNTFLNITLKDAAGTRFDALTTMLLGFKLSDLTEIGLNAIEAENVVLVLEHDKLTRLNLEFGGMQSNNIEGFKLSARYETGAGANAINLTRFDSPEFNEFQLSQTGHMSLQGTVEFDGIDEIFQAVIQSQFNIHNNFLNKFLLDIRRGTLALPSDSPHFSNEGIVTVYYVDEVLYISLDGYMNSFMLDSINLKDLGFPNVRIDGMDVAQEVATYASILTVLSSFQLSPLALVALMSGSFGGGTFSDAGVILNKIDTDETRLKITIDDELLGILSDGNATGFLSFLASATGISEDMLGGIFGAGSLNGLSIVFSYDFLTRAIAIELFGDNGRICIFNLTPQPMRFCGHDADDCIYGADCEDLPHNFEITAPLGFENHRLNDRDIFKEITPPETVHISFNVDMVLTGELETDISRLLGVFLGDAGGQNTFFMLSSTDILKIEADAWLSGDDVLIYALISLYNLRTDTTVPFIFVKSLPSDPQILLVEFFEGAGFGFGNIAFRMPREAVALAFDQVLGADNIFSSANIMDIYSSLVGRADANSYRMEHDYIRFSMSPNVADGVSVDPMFDLLGVAGIMAIFNVNIGFKMPTFSFDVNPSRFDTPRIQNLVDRQFESMYQAYWQDTVTVVIDGRSLTFNLHLQEETATLISSEFMYWPTGFIFGQEVSYMMLLTDQINGTRRVDSLLLNSLVLDPSMQTPLPDMLEVIYDGGFLGRQPYYIENFPFTNDSIRRTLGGLPAALYTVVIGKGSMAETRFTLRIEIASRHIATSDRIGNIAIIDTVVIDPYEFSQQKTLNPNFDPLLALRTNVLIRFHHSSGVGLVPEVWNLNWDFDDRVITFGGDVVFAYALINDMYVALRVIIERKAVSYIQIIYFDEQGNHIASENRGEYTVDALVEDTYNIPALSGFRAGDRVNIEIRVYFESGTFRIVGNQPSGSYALPDGADGFFFLDGIVWSINRATNVTIDRNVNPLRDATGNETNVTIGRFGDSIAGLQFLNLRVVSPHRRIGNLIDTVPCITELHLTPDGQINRALTRESFVHVSAVGYGVIGSPITDEPGAPIIVKPGDGISHAPMFINAEVEFAGGMVRRSYPVSWVPRANVISADGQILSALAEDVRLMVQNTIGDVVGNMVTLTMIIHNLDSSYTSITFDAPAGHTITRLAVTPPNLLSGDYLMVINPYQKPHLPRAFTMNFGETVTAGVVTPPTNTRRIENARWFASIGGNVVEIDDTHLFSYLQGDYAIFTTIETDSQLGTFTQIVTLWVRVPYTYEVAEKRVHGLTHPENFTQQGDGGFATINIYDQEAGALLQNILNPNFTISVLFRLGATNTTAQIAGLPVAWDTASLADLQRALTLPEGSSNFAGGTVTLTGYIFAASVFGSDVLQQAVEMTFLVPAREIQAINFANIARDVREPYHGIVEINVTIRGVNGAPRNEIDVAILRPYALIGLLAAKYNFDNPDNLALLITIFLREMFEDGAVTFLFHGVGLPVPLNVFYEERNFEHEIFTQGNEPYQTLSFLIFQIGLGSSAEEFWVNLTVTADDFVAGGHIQRLDIETFRTDGGFVFDNITGFPVPTSIAFNYTLSGAVTYWNLNWVAREAVVVGTQTVFRAGDRVTHIPVSCFVLTGYIWLRAMVYPQNTEVLLAISFLQKEIQFVNYDDAPVAQPNRYTVRDGVIDITNIYSYFPFDASRLPTHILPRQTPTYQILGAPVMFPVRWVPTPAFASANPEEFCQDKINEWFTYKGLNEPMLFARASILMYGGRVQWVNLFVSVEGLTQQRIEYSETDPNSPTVNPITEGGVLYNVINFCPYQNNFNGNFDIAGIPFVGRFEHSRGEFATTFNAGTFRVYLLVGGLELRVNSLADDPVNGGLRYNYLGHTLGAAFGEPTDMLKLKIVLLDGQVINLRITFLKRELVKVDLPNKATATGNDVEYLENLYYIDPYDVVTRRIPRYGIFTFTDGHDNHLMELPITVNQILTTDNLFNSDGILHEDTPLTVHGLFAATMLLSGYAGVPQALPIEIVILNRLLLQSSLNRIAESFLIDNFGATPRDPISYLVEDLERDKGVTEADFVALNDSIYDKFHQISSPVVPVVRWFEFLNAQGNRQVFNNFDITHQGIVDREVFGNISVGTFKGQEIKTVISALRWSFVRIVTLPGQGQHDTLFIDIDPFTLHSVERQFTLEFLVTDPRGVAAPRLVEKVFYTEEHAMAASSEEYTKRQIIQWGERNMFHTGFITFRLGNMFKMNPVVDVFNEQYLLSPSNVYQFNFLNISVTELDFGFGFGANGAVNLVIDPFNPSMPEFVMARGLDIGGTSVEPREAEMRVRFDTNINPQNFLRGGWVMAQVTVLPILQISSVPYQFSVNVHFLDRTPLAFLTNEAGLSPMGTTGEWLLATFNAQGAQATNFEIDPLEERHFELINGVYTPKMPARHTTQGEIGDGVDVRNMTITFRNNFQSLLGSNAYYTQETINLLNFAILEFFGSHVVLTDVDWQRSAPITISGTQANAPILCHLRAFTLQCGTRFNGVALPNLFALQLRVLNRQIVSTSISEFSIEHNAQLAVGYFVDPYNIALPSFIELNFVGFTRRYDNLVWEFDYNGLTAPEIISGRDAQGNIVQHFVEGTFRIFGSVETIRFPVAQRYIDDSLGGGVPGTRVIDGGRLFVLRGVPLREQLPTHIYYNFVIDEIVDGEPSQRREIARVPLTFEATDLAGFSTDEVRLYSARLRGSLGSVSRGNIDFQIEVIDPKLFNVYQETLLDGSVIFHQGSFIYDHVAIAIGVGGTHFVGRERFLLPSAIVVNDRGDYLRVVGIDFNIAGGFVTFETEYVFVNMFDMFSSDHLFGAGGERNLTISFNVPIVTYDHTRVDTADGYALAMVAADNSVSYLSTANPVGIATIFVPLGVPILASGMPKAVANANIIDLIWDMDAVDIFTATASSTANPNSPEFWNGYRAFGWFKSSLGVSDEFLVLNIVVQKAVATEADITIRQDWFGRNFSGTPLPLRNSQFLTVGRFIRPDGSLGAPNFVIEYQIGNSDWLPESAQPVGAGADYRVRIRFTDVNVDGERIFNFHINQIIIWGDHPIMFQQSAGSALIASGGSLVNSLDMPLLIKYRYTGLAQFPLVSGVPFGAQPQILFYALNASGAVLGQVPAPLNAGLYRMTVSFPSASNPNHFSEAEFFVEFEIEQAQVAYSVRQTMTYNGEFRGAEILFNVANIGSMNVAEVLSVAVIEYLFYYDTNNTLRPIQNNMMRDAGAYHVRVFIPRTLNFPGGGADGQDGWLEDGLIIVITINPSVLYVDIGFLQTEYLDDLITMLDWKDELSFASAINFFGDQGLTTQGLQGTDAGFLELFRSFFNVQWVGGVLTNVHMVGEYVLEIIEYNAARLSNYNLRTTAGEIRAISGLYRIAADFAGTTVINNKFDLNSAIAMLRSGQDVRWYLRAEMYDPIVINVNARVSIIGSYIFCPTTGERQIGVHFDSITVLQGSVTIDIIAFTAAAFDLESGHRASVFVGANASSVTINRSEFINTNQGVISRSVAIESHFDFGGMVSISNTTIRGYIIAAQLLGGSVTATNNTITQNQIGIQAQSATTVVLVGNTFTSNSGAAVTVLSNIATGNLTIEDNTFNRNGIAVRSHTIINLPTLNSINTFTNNAVILQQI
jgi:hypothetical protein